MKLLRFGDKHHEKPGLLDAQGHIRDLSGVIDDIAGDVLAPASLARLRDIPPSSLPLVEGTPRLGACVAASASSSASSQLFRPRSRIGDGRAEGRRVRQVDERDLGAERRRRDSARLGKTDWEVEPAW